MENNITKNKMDFLDNEILSLSITAGFARGKIYKDNVNESEKNKLKELLKVKLKKYSKKYNVKIKEGEHNKNIERFANEVTADNKSILMSKCLNKKCLKSGRFRIGTTQKILNLYLKYLWVLSEIPEPPHCPFDGIIISKLGLDAKWTKLDDIQKYKSLVNKAREKANKISIAEWELEEWNKYLLNRDS